MTIIALSATDECVRIGVDTLSDRVDGTRGEAQKLHYVAPLNALLVGRGAMLLGVAAAQLLGVVRSFKEAVTALDAELPTYVDHIANIQAAGADVPERANIDGQQTLLLIGYDVEAGRMAVHRFEKNATTTAFERQEVGGSFIAPLPDEPERGFDLAAGWKPEDEGEFVRMSCAQVAWGRKAFPDGAWGGRLLMAEVRRGAFACRSVCAL